MSETGFRRYVEIPGSEIYEKVNPKETACESDAAIYRRLKGTCFHYQGKWKRWLPFYGVTDVREVNFQFIGPVERGGRFLIKMTTVNIEQIQEEVDCTIAIEPDQFDAQLSELCSDENWHSTKCQNIMEFSGEPCIMVQIEAARRRKRTLAMLHLLRDCGRDPWKANGLLTLEGMAQESCIFDVETLIVPQAHQRYDRTDELRGLQFVLGWQLDRMACELPTHIAWSCLGLAMTWLCVIAWAGPTSDWATAMAFGQLIASSISLLLLYTR